MASAPDADCAAQFAEAVRDAATDKQRLYLRGGNSKRRLYGRHCGDPELALGEHRGVIRYQPEEMVLTARAGTPLTELTEVAAAHRQQLPFEAGLFDGRATLGGTLACNFSGPSRPWLGSVRDAVLGVKLINGHGELLRFGGEVIKNVAGYDLSRLQAGALGTLGIISEVSLRLIPMSRDRTTYGAALPAEEALTVMRRLARRPLPLRGACWWNGQLYVAVDGGDALASELQAAHSGLEPRTDTPWEALREWSVPVFSSDEPLWELRLAAATALDPAEPPVLLDWAGGRRLYRGSLSADDASALAAAGNGHAVRVGAGMTIDYPGPALDPALRELQRRVKQAIDPHGIFNRGRLYEWQ